MTASGIDEVDLLIVGAGLHGLIMAKTYLEVNTTSKLLVVDSAVSLGGSWASERLYQGLKTNNIFGTYELSDFPLVPERYGAKSGGHIPGRVVHDYLSDMAAHYGIDKCLRFRTKVESAKLDEGRGWTVQLRALNRREDFLTTIRAARLVFATGLTSEPSIPTFTGQADFDGPIIHSKQLKDNMGKFASYKDIVVLGGNKSSWDACYGAATAGCRVHTVMRPSGGGPSYLWPRVFWWGMWRLSLGVMSSTRLFTLFDPTLYGNRGPFSWLRSFIHRPYLGQILCQWFWNALDAHIKKMHRFRDHPETAKLEPWHTPFWMGNSLGIHNYDSNWFELVRKGRIAVHIAEVSSLSKHQVRLSNNETLAADALVCCTGWKVEPPLRFEPAEIADCIRLPTTKDTDVTSQLRAAEQDLHHQRSYLATLPHRTANAPAVPTTESTHHHRPSPPPPPPTYQLHRMLIPCHAAFLLGKHRPLAFIGMHSSVHAVIVAQAQALWITAFFRDEIPCLRQPENHDMDLGKMRYEVMLQSVYEQTRRPRDAGGAEGRYPDLVFDSLPYVDCLLRELGVEGLRKRRREQGVGGGGGRGGRGGFLRGWWRELVENYSVRDYRGLVEEWLAQRGDSGGGGGGVGDGGGGGRE